MLNTVNQRELLSKQKEAPAAQKVAEKVGVVNFIDGSNLGELELTKKLTNIALFHCP